MKRLLLILILTFSFQTWTKADDIRDFEIEGISLGDSLLDYFTETEIIENNIDKGKQRKFHRVLILSEKDDRYSSIVKKLELYDGMQVYINPKDNYYKIYGLEGILDFESNFSQCISKKSEIENELAKLFKDSKKINKKTNHPADTTNKSIVYETFIQVDLKSQFYELRLQCFNWSKKMGHVDHFRIAILSDDVNEDINNLYE